MTIAAPVLPVVDISDATNIEAVRDVDRACREVGFLQVVGHPISAATIARALATSDAFFALDGDTKGRYRPPNAAVNRGYAPLGSESLAYGLGLERPPDLFEAFNIGPDEPADTDPARASRRDSWFHPNIWPVEVPELQPAFVDYFLAARATSAIVLRLVAAALSLESDYFEALTDHPIEAMRSIRYERAADAPALVEDQQRMGPHTDYGLVTVLYADPVPGLEILGPDGDWRPVVPDEGALIINLGDMLARWTNDHYRSTVHRVVPPEGDGASLRRSIAYFHDGNHDAVVECLPGCTQPGVAPTYPPVVLEDHLRAKLLGPRTNVASSATNTAAGRMADIADSKAPPIDP